MIPSWTNTCRAVDENRFPLAVDAVLLDLDGTLVDTAPDLAAAANQMLRDLDRPTVELEQIRGWVGDGAKKLVERVLLDGENRADLSVIERGYELFFKHYARLVCDQSLPYPGVMQTINTLCRQRLLLGCVTNKPERFTRPLLEQLAMDVYFSSIVSGDSCAAKKPDPEPLLKACEEMGVTPAACVLVGDSANDVLAAQAAKMPVICVSYGYNRGLNLNAMNPDAVIDRFDELPALLIKALNTN